MVIKKNSAIQKLLESSSLKDNSEMLNKKVQKRRSSIRKR